MLNRLCFRTPDGWYLAVYDREGKAITTAKLARNTGAKERRLTLEKMEAEYRTKMAA